MFFMASNALCSNSLSSEELFRSIETMRLNIEKEKEIRLKEINRTIVFLESSLIDHYTNLEEKLSSLIEIRRLEKEIKKVEYQFDLKFTKFRYKKGIEVLKMVI